MKLTQSWIYPFVAGGFLALVAAPVIGPGPSQAQSVNSLRSSSAINLSLPKPPKDPRAPKGRQKGGSSRGGGDTDLSGTVPTLTALVPATAGPNQENFVWGLTTAERPTLWFMMPALEAAPIEFILQDDQDRYIHKANFVLPQALSRGVIQMDLPDSIPALEFDKRYTWTFSIKATPNHPHMFVQGTIYRVPLATPLQQPIGQATDLEKVRLYSQSGLWHDAIATLAQLRQASPQNTEVKRAWFDLLKQASLDEIAHQPLLPCCATGFLRETQQESLNSQD